MAAPAACALQHHLPGQAIEREPFLLRIVRRQRHHAQRAQIGDRIAADGGIVQQFQALFLPARGGQRLAHQRDQDWIARLFGRHRGQRRQRLIRLARGQQRPRAERLRAGIAAALLLRQPRQRRLVRRAHRGAQLLTGGRREQPAAHDQDQRGAARTHAQRRDDRHPPPRDHRAGSGTMRSRLRIDT
jgi:hypothetical protein